jgi:SAM-dependent methyltransferase
MEEAMDPYGHALNDFYYSGEDVPVVIVRDDGYKDDMSVKQYFRMREKFSNIENLALKKCRGRVVDLSAGVGADCLELQNRGFNVTAVEINPSACEIMKKRGVKKVHCKDLFEFKEEGYDTILLFGRSIGNVQILEGLKTFLIHAKTILNKEGQIILDSMDVRKTTNQIHLKYQQKSIEMGRYFGEIVIRFEYKNIIGPNFGILHVDPDTLRKYCEQTGWICDLLFEEEDGSYLANLTQKN